MYADTKKRWWIDRTGDVNDPNVQWAPGQVPPDSEPNYELNPEIARVEEAIFHPAKITGCCLVVADYDGVFDFFTTKAGLIPRIGGRECSTTVFGGSVGMRDLSIVSARDDLPAQFHHMNFVCADEADLETSIGKAKEAGITIVAEIDHPTRRAIIIGDPDGLRINFYVDRSTPPDEAALTAPQGIYLA